MEAPWLRPSLPLVEVHSVALWRAWLAQHHATSPGAGAVTRKRSAVVPGQAYVSSRDLNEACLCFGWIDSKPGKVDAERTALLCTPRKRGSGWSKVNKDRLEPLLAAGLVAPAGLAAIEAARADGSWSRLDEVDALTEPEDLLAALREVADAQVHWSAFPPSTRRGILEWISQAMRESTRAARVAETARLAGRNERANAWPRPSR